MGLTLMATILVSSLLAFSAHHRARRVAQAKLVAIPIADELIDRLLNRKGGLLATRRGPIVGHPDWIWRTDPVGITAPAGLPTSVVRLRIDQATADGRWQSLVSVDLVEGRP